MNERPLVLYHANCNDGFCAAWAAWRKFGSDADYLPVQYGQEPPDVTGRLVFILDFSYKRPVLLKMASKAAGIVVLDHHKTAMTDLVGGYELSDGPRLLANGLTVRFDMNKSGGRLAWENFHPNQPPPWLVDYTEDRDLWRWKLEESREVNACLASWPRTFEEWDKLAFDTTAVAHFAEQGSAILRYQSQLIDSICVSASEIDLDGYRILAANTSCLFSEVAGKLAVGRPFGAAYFFRNDGKLQWSLRSSDDGIDVSEIAKKHGGGGHVRAAGFTC